MAGAKKAGGAWDEAYDPSYFAKKHGLTEKQAKIVIQSNGPSKQAFMRPCRANVCGRAQGVPSKSESTTLSLSLRKQRYAGSGRRG